MPEDSRYWAAYRRELNEFFNKRIKLGFLWGLFIYPLFGFLDWTVYPAHLQTFLTFRGIVVIAVVIGLLVLNTGWGKRRPTMIATVEYLIMILSIVAMVHVAEGYRSPYYAGIIVILLFLHAICPLSFRSTLFVTTVVLLAYLLPIFIFDRVTDWPIFTNNTTFLTGVILFTNVSNFYDNKMREQEFRSRYRLQRANEKLKQLDVMKSQFFANVSHEVRTPLTSILAPIQSLYLGDVGGLSREQHRLISQVYRNSLRLLDMINQMLDFSRFEAGKMSLRLGPLNLDEVAQDTSALFEEVANRKGLKLVFVREGSIPPAFLDITKVERILTNLIRNALKFTDQGTITVRVSRKPGKVILEVEDTGIGIPERHLPNIFTRFQQVDGSSTRKYEGTGLGLTIVKESVDLMRGIISVRSREGQGSCFRVELPDNLEQLEPAAFIERRSCERRRLIQQFCGEDQRRQIRRRDDLARVTLEDLVLIERDYLPRQVEPALEEEERAPAEDADRVLLIEDNTDLRNYIGRMLKSFGHRVMTTGDGWEGWQRIQSELPDLIVSDVMMPRMDGYELLRQVKGNPRTRHIPIILITAKSEVESRIQGLMTGADDYLAKPVNVRELDARIRNLITSRKLQRAMALASELDARMDELSLSFSESLELRDANTAGHSREVLDFGLMIAQELALPVDRTLKESLLLHDIGKLGIPDRILFKESSLDEQEWKVMKRHPEMGESLLGKFSYYRGIGAIILAHQECYNGSGYPRGLREEEIPLIARIIAVADAYHAMITDRPYRKALSARHALDEIIRNSGTQFDPRIVEAFLRGLEKRGAVSAAAHLRNAPPRTAGF